MTRIVMNLGVLLSLGVLLCAALVAGCGGSGQSTPPEANGQGGQVDAETPNQSQLDEMPDRGFTLEVPFDAIGGHLEATEIEVGLRFWLEASEDVQIAALPGRSKASVGVLFQPSLDSPTEETFWIHVYTDQSREMAIDWVRHLASQPPALARIIVPQHELFEASFRQAPNVGDASVLIEMHHGHGAGCWRSALLVFAQDGVIVFMKSVIEVTRTDALGAGAATCDDSDEIAPLTDINRIAFAFSEQLAGAG